MKLTKDDFQQDEDWDCFLRCTNEQRDQILKDQEDAEKYQNCIKPYGFKNAYEIIGRLKKRIEDIKITGPIICQGVGEWPLEDELQKILDGKE